MKPTSPSIPLLVVDDPAPCRDFWCNHLDLTAVVESVVEARLDFVLLHGPPCPDGTPLVIEYQRRAGLPEALASRLPAATVGIAYLWVDDLAPVRARLDAGAPEAIVGGGLAPYGADELFVRDPEGQLFIFGARRPG